MLLFFFLIAFLYASVGHGGASGYIALMVLIGLSPETIRPVALIMNISVSLIGTVHFYRSGHFRKELLFPFIILSVPLAFFGAKLQLPVFFFNLLLGVCLVVAMYRLLTGYKNDVDVLRPLPTGWALTAGGVIGFISGLIGVGGGILLSPFLLLGRWATLRQAAAVAAPFILINSLSALIAGGCTIQGVSSLHLAGWVAAVVFGGWLGAYAGSVRLPVKALRYFLTMVLLLATFKLMIR
jgi:uncharacterized membrane protein YfcA